MGIAYGFLLLAGDMNAVGNQIPVDSLVSVELNQQEYHQDEEIIVTIANNLDISITTIDQQAFCTIVRLKQLIGKEWKEVINCFTGMPPKYVTLGAHSETIVKLPGLSQGIYQVYINYSLGLAYDLSKTYTSFSSQFIVK